MAGAPETSPTTWLIVLFLALMSVPTTPLGIAHAIWFERNARAVQSVMVPTLSPGPR